VDVARAGAAYPVLFSLLCFCEFRSISMVRFVETLFFPRGDSAIPGGDLEVVRAFEVPIACFFPSTSANFASFYCVLLPKIDSPRFAPLIVFVENRFP